MYLKNPIFGKTVNSILTWCFFKKWGFRLKVPIGKLRSVGKFPIRKLDSSDRKVGKFRSEGRMVPIGTYLKTPFLEKTVNSVIWTWCFFKKWGFRLKVPIGR